MKSSDTTFCRQSILVPTVVHHTSNLEKSTYWCQVSTQKELNKNKDTHLAKFHHIGLQPAS